MSIPTLAHAETPLVLALDLGTSSTRARLYDARGRAVAGVGAQTAYELRLTQAGAAEDDPAEAVARAARCVDAVLEQLGPAAARIGAVAVDTLASTCLALDARGQPLTPLLTYADTRGAEEARALQRQLDEPVVHDRTGCLLRSSYWPAQLAWQRRAQPALWRAAAHWVTLGDYLERCLFGGPGRVSHSAASWTGLLDRRRLVWDAPLMDGLGLRPGQLSPLVEAETPRTGLAAPFAARWPALAHVPWFPAVGDGAAANLGSGCTGPDRVALTLGTTGALRVVQAQVEAVPAGLWCYRVDRQQALVGGATSEGGNVYTWLRQTVKLGDPAEVEAAVAAFPADGHGLTVLPFLAGERSPGWAGDIPATLHGLTLATPPIAILRASLEAVAYRFALIQARLGLGGQARRLIASGSALQRSPAWAQIFADVLGQPVALSAEPEATSRGAALLALRALGALPSLDAAPAALGPEYLPDPARQARYQAAIERQAELYRRMVSAP